MPTAQPDQTTQDQLQAEERELIEDLIKVMKAKPRRISTTLIVLRTLFEGTAMQLPPEGRGDAALVAAELATNLVRSSTTQAPNTNLASRAVH